MKCPECERTDQRSKFYMPTTWMMTAAGGSQDYYDEDGEHHYHEVNRGKGQAHCSEGHYFKIGKSTQCSAQGCDYGSPESVELING